MRAPPVLQRLRLQTASAVMMRRHGLVMRPTSLKEPHGCGMKKEWFTLGVELTKLDTNLSYL